MMMTDCVIHVKNMRHILIFKDNNSFRILNKLSLIV